MSNVQDNAEHTCSYSCDRPQCIKAQRDELAAAAAQEAVAWQVGDEFYPSESLAIEAIQQWGPSGAIAIPLYASASAALEAGTVEIIGRTYLVRDVMAALAKAGYAALVAAAPGIDLEQFREPVEYFRDAYAAQSPGPDSWHALKVSAADRLLALIDASPKGGSEARDAALNTLAQMFHNSEEMEGPDGMVVSIDLSLWHEALEAYEVLIDGYDEVTLATSAQAQASDAEGRL